MNRNLLRESCGECIGVCCQYTGSTVEHISSDQVAEKQPNHYEVSFNECENKQELVAFTWHDYFNQQLIVAALCITSFQGIGLLHVGLFKTYCNTPTQKLFRFASRGVEFTAVR